ncbi:unnamed protein product [Arabidopsis halleri]
MVLVRWKFALTVFEDLRKFEEIKISVNEACELEVYGGR